MSDSIASHKKIVIPLHGKMSSRVFHQPLFRNNLRTAGFDAFYFLSPHYFRSFKFDANNYFELRVDEYQKYLDKHPFLQQIKLLRRFSVLTETTDLRFRELIEDKLFVSKIPNLMGHIAYVALLSRISNIGRLAAFIESRFYVPSVHEQHIKQIQADCALIPGLGYYNFWNEGYFASEAKKIGLKIFSAITNYDAIVNKGYPAFTPDCLAVWSRQMADDAMRLFGLSSNKIEITGPLQYDRFLHSLPMKRDDFIKSIGLNPKNKTIFFAGGVNITRYFEIYNLLVESAKSIWKEEFNLIIRPYPHAKLLNSPGWKVLEQLFNKSGVYISNPGSIDGDDRVSEYKQDLWLDEGTDELTYILRYSDVMINSFSTISLEAAICDLPVIHLGYDSYTFGHRYGITSEFQQRQTHNLRELRLSASKVAKNEHELIFYLEKYLSDKTLDQINRLDYAVSECGEMDGNAGTRLINMIKSRL